jgi:mRNA-degrading endonuclease YafQ of YafQ-DinJ toxin-antitoxin module
MEKNSFSITYTSKYERDFRKVSKKDKVLAEKILLISHLLSIDPYSTRLRTHRVNTFYGSRVYSSRVSGDIRILWKLEDGNIILLLTIGGHSGGSKVYK